MVLSIGWSLDPKKWEIVRSQASTDKWKYCDLVMGNREVIPEQAGVYVICARASDNSEHKLLNSLKNCLYVGQSDSLKRRFREHVNGYGNVKSAKSCFPKLEFWWVVLGSQEQTKEETKVLLNTYEGMLQAALGPAANKVAAPTAISLTLKPPVYPNETKQGEL